MARGWESKQVEDQQAEAERRGDARGRRALTPAEQAARQRRETLELALTRTRTALEAARQGPHRDMLAMQVQAIERELASLPPQAQR